MKYAALLAILALSACGTTQIGNPVVVERPVPSFPEAQPATQLPTEWIVLTRENFEQRMTEIESEGGQFVVFAVTAEGYQNLNMNQAELRRYIEQQSAIVSGYQEYVAPAIVNTPERRPLFRIITRE
jgi:hypothetical protein